MSQPISPIGHLGISTLYQMRRQDYKNLQQAVQSNNISAAQQTLQKYKTSPGQTDGSAVAGSQTPEYRAQARLVGAILSGQGLADSAPALESNESAQTRAIDTLSALLNSHGSGGTASGLATLKQAIASYATAGAEAG